MIRATASGEMPSRLAEVCRQYSSLARIDLHDLVTDGAEKLGLINGLRSPFARSEWYNATAFSHEMNHVSCERDDGKHAEWHNLLLMWLRFLVVVLFRAVVDHGIHLALPVDTVPSGVNVKLIRITFSLFPASHED